MIPGMIICTAPERLAVIQAPDITGWSATYPPLLQGTLNYDNPVRVRIYVKTGWDPSQWDSNDVETRQDFQIIDAISNKVIREGFLATMAGPEPTRWRSLPMGLMVRFRPNSESSAVGDEVIWSVLPFRMAGPLYEELDVSAAIGSAAAIPRIEQLPDTSLNFNTLVDGAVRPLEGPRTQAWNILGGMGEDVRGQLYDWRQEGREVIFFPPYTKDTRLLAHFQDDLLSEIGGHYIFSRDTIVGWYERVRGSWAPVSGDFPRFMPSPWVGRAMVAEKEATNLFYPSTPQSDVNLGPTVVPSGSGHVVTRETKLPRPVESHHSCLRWRRGSVETIKMEWTKSISTTVTGWIFSVFVRGAAGVDGAGVAEFFLDSDATTFTTTARVVLTDQWQRIFIRGVGGAYPAPAPLTVNLNAVWTPPQDNDVIFVDGWMLEEVGNVLLNEHAFGFGPSGYIHTTGGVVTKETEEISIVVDDIPGDQGFLSFWMHHIATEAAYVGVWQVDSSILTSDGATAKLEFGVTGRAAPDETGYYVEYRGTRVKFYGSTGTDFPEAFEPMHVGIRWKSVGSGNDLAIALFINGVKLDEITDTGTNMYPSLGTKWEMTQDARGLPIGEMRMDRTALTDAEILDYYNWMTDPSTKPLMQALLGRQFTIGKIRARDIREGTHQLMELEVPMIEGTVRPEFQAVKAREDITRGRI